MYILLLLFWNRFGFYGFGGSWFGLILYLVEEVIVFGSGGISWV